MQRNICLQIERIRAGYRHKPLVHQMADPWNDGAVIELDDELHTYGDTSSLPNDQANQVNPSVTRRHTIDHRSGTFIGFIIGFQNQRAVPVPAQDSSCLS